MQSRDQKNEKIEPAFANPPSPEASEGQWAMAGEEEKSVPADAGRDKLYSEELLEEDFEVEKDLENLPI
ncbi:MAG: hypothetical protein Q8O83_01015 [bacterium]|nr:hypothetical protein [bacterium]